MRAFTTPHDVFYAKLSTVVGDVLLHTQGTGGADDGRLWIPSLNKVQPLEVKVNLMSSISYTIYICHVAL